jgi:hypothetical protein
MPRENIMESVLRDTAQTTLQAQREADDIAVDDAASFDAGVNEKFERLAFTKNAMPTRQATVPQLGGDAAVQ